jgi:hypothetical protein
MSGQKTCAAVVNESERRKNNEKANRTMNAIATFGVSELFNSDKKVDEPTVNIINNNYSEIKKKISENRCQNVSRVKQYNIFEQPVSCYDAINKTCINNKTGVPDVDCLDMLYSILDESSSKPVSQINLNKVQSVCEINASLQVLSEKDQNEDNLNTVRLLQEARSKAQDKQPEALNCTEINSNITKEKYINSYLKCSNITTVNQENLISSCTPNISLQLNDNNEMKRCLQNLGIMGGENPPEETNPPFTTPITTTSVPTTTPVITTPSTTTPIPKTTTPVPIINKGIPTEIIIIIGGVVLIIIVIVIVVIINNTNNTNNSIIKNN